MRNNNDDHANRPVKHYLTDAEKQMMVDRHFERAKYRQAEADLNLLKAIELARRLRDGE